MKLGPEKARPGGTGPARSDVRRPQLTLDELYQVKWLLGGILTLLGVGTVLYMDVDAWSLMGLTAFVTIVMMMRPEWVARVPGYVHTLAFPVIVAFCVSDVWLRAEILPAMVRLDILLLLYRGMTYRQRRDDLQIVVLGLFLIIIAGVLTVSLAFALHLLVYTASALALLLVITLTEAAAGDRTPKALPPGIAPSWALHVKWAELLRRLRGVADWRVVTLGAVLFAGVIGVSALLFLAIPRFQLENTLFLDRLITKKAKSGFNDSIRFGDVTEIQEDNSLALSVDVSDQSRIPESPYWRMVVLDEYINGTFKLSPGLRSQEFGPERVHGSVRGGHRLIDPEPVYWTFYLESGVSRYLPLLGRFVEMRFREQQNVRQAVSLGIVALRDEPTTMTAYRVEGFDLSGVLPDPAFAQRWKGRTPVAESFPALQSRLSLPEADVQVLRTITGEISEGRELPAAEFTRRTNEWLRRNHRYSLAPSVPSGEGDPLVRWLNSRAQGHCELFAGSFVLLARSAGFPARVVTGFRGGTWNGYSNNFTIRNADAHAWAEIFDVSAGAWLRADPLESPRAPGTSNADTGAQAMASRLDRSWKARLDSLRVFWYRRIVSFDHASQLETLKAMKEATQTSSRRLREIVQHGLRALEDWLAGPWNVKRVTLLVGGLAAAVLAGVLGWILARKGWRSWRRTRGVSPEDPIRREAGRWLERLQGNGASGASPDTVAQLQRLRFGPAASWGNPDATFRRARQVRREARRRRVTPS